MLKRDVQNLMDVIISLLQVLQLWSRSQKVGGKYAAPRELLHSKYGGGKGRARKMGYSVRSVPFTEWVSLSATCLRIAGYDVVGRTGIHTQTLLHVYRRNCTKRCGVCYLISHEFRSVSAN